MSLDITKIPLDDSKVWDLICEGRVKGCFQVESSLGKTWCKKIKPRNISELSDLLSVVRPGTLRYIYEGKSMAQHYADRKAGLEPAVPIDPSLEEILKSTQQIILFQESLLQIGSKIAGFNDKQNRKLIKGVGKKDAELLFSLEKEFIEGCVNTGIVNEERAKLIFDNIKKSARYLFNKSICPYTPVQIENGEIKTINELKVGEFIKTPNGFAKVLDKMNHGILPTYKITLQSGKSIECSINHKFLCKDGETKPLWLILFLGNEIVIE